jgi:hypothetical protein
MAKKQQQSEDSQTLLRALLNLKVAARRQRERESVNAAEQLETAVAAAEYRRSISRTGLPPQVRSGPPLQLACQHSKGTPSRLDIHVVHMFLVLTRTLLFNYQERQQPL